MPELSPPIRPGPPSLPDLLAVEDLPPRPQQERSRRTRAALTGAALDLFAEHGYEQTSIGEIAARAGVSAGTLYQHFRSKRQVLLVLMTHLLEELDALDLDITKTADPEAALEQALREGLMADRAYGGAYRAWREAVLSDRELGELDLQVEAWTAQRVEMALRLALQLPGARLDIDVEGAAQLLNLLFWRIAEAPQVDDERAIRVVTRLMTHLLFEDRALLSSGSGGGG